ncbi:hypothetical protein J6X96_06820 [bacterium]|nr:hypothetical protein [bacterium]
MKKRIVALAPTIESVTLIASKPRIADGSWHVIDWKKAAEIILKHKPQKAAVGMPEGWEITEDVIFENGKPLDPRTVMMTSWGTFALRLDDSDVYHLCFKKVKNPRRGCYRAWPKRLAEKLRDEAAIW